jgi:hypothetical protein
VQGSLALLLSLLPALLVVLLLSLRPLLRSLKRLARWYSSFGLMLPFVYALSAAATPQLVAFLALSISTRFNPNSPNILILWLTHLLQR